jgi:hypothetical protein
VRRDPPPRPHGEGPKAYILKGSYNLGAWSKFIMGYTYLAYAK